MSTMCDRRFLTVLMLAGLLGMVPRQLARAADHPLTHSTVTYLPMPASGEWAHIAISPDGSQLYVAHAFERVVAIDTSTDTVAATITLPNNEYIGGIAVGPNGRVFVTTRVSLIEIDPTTYQVVNNVTAPWYWEGRIVVTSDGMYAYSVNGDEIYVADLSGGSIAFVDTVAGGAVHGLIAANPTWPVGWVNAWRLALSPDDDRLYVVGGLSSNSLHQIVTIDGLATGGGYGSLTLSTVEMPNATGSSAEPRLTLSTDGTLLFDCYGNVWQTSTMQVVQTIGLAQWSGFGPVLVARSANGAYIYYQGWSSLSGSSDLTAYGGEELLVASGASYDLIDLDGNASDGLDGIDLPEANGWTGGGSYNAHEMVINADGDKLYIAAGSSGALAVALAVTPTSGVVVPDRGGNDGDVTVRIAGSFQSGVTVALGQTGQSDITGTNTTVLSGGNVETRFDLTGAASGAYDVVFTPASGSPWRLTNGFTVEQATEEATLDVLGNRIIQATVGGADATVYMRATNSGNVDLEDLVITFSLTSGTEYKLTMPPTVPDVATPTPEQETSDGYPVHIWISRLAPQRSYTLTLVVSGQSGAPATWNINLTASVGYLKGPDSGASSADTSAKLRKVEAREGAIGDLCSFGDAVIKAVNAELAERGVSSLDAAGEGVVQDVIVRTAVEFGVGKLSGMVAKALAQLVVTALVPEALPVFAVTFGVVSDMKSCYDFVKSLLGFDALFPTDPNDKLCLIGVGTYLTGKETLRFRIRFENVSTATAAAQTVRITDVIDSDLDWDTLAFGDSSHPEKLSVAFDSTTRMITWTFSLLDLAPNVTPPEGEGWVEFTIKPVSGSADGTTITNQARIYFDLNDPIDTNTITRTIDSTAPSSAVAALSSASSSTSLALSWSGTDAGAGVGDYTVHVARDSGDYQIWQEQTTSTSGTYTAEAGYSYKFYSVARDKLGNTEAAPSTPDTTTTVSPTATSDGSAPATPGCGCGAASAATVSLCVVGLMRATRRRG